MIRLALIASAVLLGTAATAPAQTCLTAPRDLTRAVLGARPVALDAAQARLHDALVASIRRGAVTEVQARASAFGAAYFKRPNTAAICPLAYWTLRRAYVDENRTTAGVLKQIKRLDERINAGEDAQQANVDLQNVLQKQQQTLQMLSTVSKTIYDTAMAVIRKIGG